MELNLTNVEKFEGCYQYLLSAKTKLNISMEEKNKYRK